MIPSYNQTDTALFVCFFFLFFFFFFGGGGGGGEVGGVNSKPIMFSFKLTQLDRVRKFQLVSFRHACSPDSERLRCYQINSPRNKSTHKIYGP